MVIARVRSTHANRNQVQIAYHTCDCHAIVRDGSQ